MMCGNNGMTPNMQKLYLDMVGSLGQLPEEMKVFLFGDEDHLDMDWV